MAPAAGASLSALIGASVWFVPPASVRSSVLRSVRQGPKGPLVRFDDVATADEARALCGAEVLVRTDDLPAGWAVAEEDDGLDDYRVSDVRHGDLGNVVDTIVTGANDVLVVHGPFGEVLIPVIDDVILDIDDGARTLSVRLLDGLLPGEADEA